MRCNFTWYFNRFLTGNPCTNYEGYRGWVITKLPNIVELDGKVVLRSERLEARRNFKEMNITVMQDENIALGK